MSDKLINLDSLQVFKEEEAALLAKKQDMLISGTNIKTINDTSLLGVGNIAIESLPNATVADEGKVLMVNSSGEYVLTTPSSGSGTQLYRHQIALSLYDPEDTPEDALDGTLWVINTSNTPINMNTLTFIRLEPGKDVISMGFDPSNEDRTGTVLNVFAEYGCFTTGVTGLFMLYSDDESEQVRTIYKNIVSCTDTVTIL